MPPRLFTAAVAALPVAVIVLMNPTTTPAAAAAPCVSVSQYAHLQPGMPLAAVADLLGGKGAFFSVGAGAFGRSYSQCLSVQNRVRVEYKVNVVDGKQVGPARVFDLIWEVSHSGDVKVRVGSDQTNTIDLEERTPYRERVFARGGDDYVFQRSNGLRDVIDCGDGNDTVFLYDGREPGDLYRGCEHVQPYAP